MKSNRSLARGLMILRAFNQAARLSLSEIVAIVDLPKPTCLRFLRTLQEEGYLYFDEDLKRYELRPLVLELGYAALSSLSLPALVQPEIDQLAEQTAGSVTIATIDNNEIVITGRAVAPPSTRKFVTLNLHVGRRLPPHATATGRLLVGMSQTDILKYWQSTPWERLTPKTLTAPDALTQETEKAIKLGYSIIKDQLSLGYSAIGVPLRHTGTRHFAIAVSLPSSLGSHETIKKEILPTLQKAADTISQAYKLSYFASNDIDPTLHSK